MQILTHFHIEKSNFIHNFVSLALHQHSLTTLDTPKLASESSTIKSYKLCSQNISQIQPPLTIFIHTTQVWTIMIAHLD